MYYQALFLREQGAGRPRRHSRRRAALVLITAKAKQRMLDFFECKDLCHNDFQNQHKLSRNMKAHVDNNVKTVLIRKIY